MGRINKVSAKKDPLQTEQRPRISCVYQSPGTMKEAGKHRGNEKERWERESKSEREKIGLKRLALREAESLTK